MNAPWQPFWVYPNRPAVLKKKDESLTDVCLKWEREGMSSLFML